MPVMSAIESGFCRSSPWNYFARGRVTPWALQGRVLQGDVLELGAGAGAMAENILRTSPSVRLVASDLDEHILAHARTRLATWPNAQVEQADSTDLPFDDASFDVVVSFLMLHHVIDWPLTIAEASRVLRPGGLLIGYDLTRTRLARWVHLADRSPHLLITPNELTAELHSHGFEPAQVDSSFVRHIMRFAATKSASE